MSLDDEAARKERAGRLHRQIDRMLDRRQPQSEKPEPEGPKRPRPRSARDFIHDKMADNARKVNE
jgi:hypothetical protein